MVGASCTKVGSKESHLCSLPRNQKNSPHCSGSPAAWGSGCPCSSLRRGRGASLRVFQCTFPETGSDWPYFSLSSVKGSSLTVPPVPGVKPPHRWLGFLLPSLLEPSVGIPGSVGCGQGGGVPWHKAWHLGAGGNICLASLPTACTYRNAHKGLWILQDRHQNFFLIRIFFVVLFCSLE